MKSFTGLFSLVQVFVTMTPKETLYFANPGDSNKFNENFYFHCADFNTERHDALMNKTKEFHPGKIDVDGEFIHVFINKIIVLDERRVDYCFLETELELARRYKLFMHKYIDLHAIFEGRIEDTINKKAYCIEYKVEII